ncbi:DUF1640 domain-containing protein [Tepidiphilus sp. J10]|uniref:DUF1640 domain-containing protein n=1 Tax=Tepidiphilus sp. J10 TaxID=2502185 RepID=UPI00115D4A53|nr:DUF1640 domain-containing protein [Tepidiphilus sp. J10]
MGAALKLYEELLEAGEDKRRAKLIAEAFEALEARYPDLRDVATHAHLRETELRLLREIEALRLETRKEIEGVRLEIKNVEVRLTQAIHRQTVWVILAIGGITGFIRWLDVFFK